MLLELLQVRDHRIGRVLVLFGFGQLQQLARLGQAIEDAGDAAYGLVQQRALAPQVLGVFGLVPDIGIFEFPRYFFEPFLLGVVVKDTP
ncbi:hypothetical protein FHY09_003126 [Xanthomonas sp. 60]